MRSKSSHPETGIRDPHIRRPSPLDLRSASIAPWVLVAVALAVAALYLFSRPIPPHMNASHNPDDPGFVMPTTEEGWRAILPPENFRVTQKKGTERAFANEYWDEKTPGIYACYCCGQELYDSRAKFDSGTGWPSFHEPIRPEAVREEEDNGWFMRRTEIVCSRCAAHLGHVFDDAPSTPTGLRYCMNSAALRLKPCPTSGDAEQPPP